MLTTKTEANIVYITASGKLTNHDYDQVIPLLEDHIKKFGQINLYLEIESFEGWDLKSFLRDIKFDVRHAGDFDKIAIVGEKKWHEYMSDVMKPFTPAQVQYYDRSDRNIAKEWIKN